MRIQLKPSRLAQWQLQMARPFALTAIDWPWPNWGGYVSALIYLFINKAQMIAQSREWGRRAGSRQSAVRQATHRDAAALSLTNLQANVRNKYTTRIRIPPRICPYMAVTN